MTNEFMQKIRVRYTFAVIQIDRFGKQTNILYHWHQL